MDRSFLSHPAVVAESRKFVCIRLATYESAAEAEVLKAALTTRSGQLENTVFALLAPDGKTPLVRSGRMARESVGEAEEGARRMAELASQHPGAAPIGGALPLLADLRRGLNVAACELQPLVVIAARTEEGRKKIEESLLRFVWRPETAGRFGFARATPAEAATVLEGVVEGDGIFVVQPDAFGLKGKVLTFGVGSDREGMRTAMARGLEAFRAEAKDSKKHIDEGVRRGLNWTTEIPVTDPRSPRREKR